MNLFSQMLTNNDVKLHGNNVRNNYIPLIYEKRLHEAAKTTASFIAQNNRRRNKL